MPNDTRIKLEQFIQRLKPIDLLNQARAVVFNRACGGLDVADGDDGIGDDDGMQAWETAKRLALEIGRSIADDAKTRAEFLPEVLVVEPRTHRAFHFGCGLAEGAGELDVIWLELITAYEAAEHKTRDAAVLGGFLFAAHKCDQCFTSRALRT